MGCIGPSIVVLQFGTLYKLSPSLCTIYKCQGETSRASFKWTNHQQTVSTNTPTHLELDPAPPGRLDSIFLSHSGIKKKKKKNQMKVAGSFFSSIIYHSASERKKVKKKKKKDLCGREANQGLW